MPYLPMPYLPLIVLLLAASSVEAGSIVVSFGGPPVTVTTSADHDATAARNTAAVNAQITAQNAANAAFNAANPLGPAKASAPLLTVEQHLANQVTILLNQAVSQEADLLLQNARSGVVLTADEQVRMKRVLRLP